MTETQLITDYHAAAYWHVRFLIEAQPALAASRKREMLHLEQALRWHYHYTPDALDCLFEAAAQAVERPYGQGG